MKFKIVVPATVLMVAVTYRPGSGTFRPGWPAGWSGQGGFPERF
jgi:hypothetical protein